MTAQITQLNRKPINQYSLTVLHRMKVKPDVTIQHSLELAQVALQRQLVTLIPESHLLSDLLEAVETLMGMSNQNQAYRILAGQALTEQHPMAAMSVVELQQQGREYLMQELVDHLTHWVHIQQEPVTDWTQPERLTAT